MLLEKDLKQIKNLITSFYEEKGYFPFVEDLITKYNFLFPDDLDNDSKNQIDNFTNKIILEWIENKNTKGSSIMIGLIKTNNLDFFEFRKLNSKRFFNENQFQQLGKKVERLIFDGESKLTEKLVGNRAMGIQKASDAWYDMVYAIFPERNKILN